MKGTFLSDRKKVPADLLINVSPAPVVAGKYSSDSSVYTEQSIFNFDSCELLYCISNILQSELFEQLETAPQYAAQFSDLALNSTLPAHLGGEPESIPEELLDHETKNDPDLRSKIISRQVPTSDAIIRFISWISQSSKYSPQCNILAFIYIKRILRIRPMLSYMNWRGMWLGAVVLAQKLHDDIPLRTSSFTTLLPGVTKDTLKIIEWRVFELLDRKLRVKPAAFAKFFFELRSLFEEITGMAESRREALGYKVRPLLSVDSIKLFEPPPDERRRSKVSTAGSGRPETLSAGSASTSRSTLPALPSSRKECNVSVGSTTSANTSANTTAVAGSYITASGYGDLQQAASASTISSVQNKSNHNLPHTPLLSTLDTGVADPLPPNLLLTTQPPVTIFPKISLRKARMDTKAKLLSETFIPSSCIASSTDKKKDDRRAKTRKLVVRDGTGSLTVEDLDFVISKALYVIHA